MSDVDCPSHQHCEGTGSFSTCPDCEAECSDIQTATRHCRSWCNKEFGDKGEEWARSLCLDTCDAAGAVPGFTCRLWCEANNQDCETLAWIGTCRPCDLAGDLLDVPDYINWGETFTVQGRVRNDSGCHAQGFHQAFYLSSDATWFDSDDLPLEVIAQPRGQMDALSFDDGRYVHTAHIDPYTVGPTFSVTLKLPDTVPPGYRGIGPFRIGMRTDWSHAVEDAGDSYRNNGPGTLARGVDWDSFHLPSVSVGDAWAREGDDARDEGRGEFPVRLTRALEQPLTLIYSTLDGSAEGGRDYQEARGGSLTLAPGNILGTIPVQLVGDQLPEPDETFDLILLGSDRVPISDRRGVGTIVNDDEGGVPRVHCVDARVVEGDSGTRLMEFAVKVEPAPQQPVPIRYRTADGSAQAGIDYLPSTRFGASITIWDAQTAYRLEKAEMLEGRGGGLPALLPPGTGGGEETRFVNEGMIRVPVVGDAHVEPDENLFVEILSASNAAVATPRCEGIIENDDLPVVSISAEASVEESYCLDNNGQVNVSEPTVQASCKVRVSSLGDQNILVYWRTAANPPSPNAATPGEDYEETTHGLVVIPPSGPYLNQPVTVSVINDRDINEQEEFFRIYLETATRGHIDPHNRECRIRIRQPPPRPCEG